MAEDYQVIENENLANGYSINYPYQFGVTDVDDGSPIEQGAYLPWVADPEATFLSYEMWLECHLDAGIVVHKTLPQGTAGIDTLAVGIATDYRLAANKGGMNTKSVGTFTDVVQRMATSRYQFVLRGHGLRMGYQVPVPGLVSIAGVPAYPGEIQWSLGNRLVGNYSGIPMFFNAWELWYEVALPPRVQQVPLPNLGEHIQGGAQLPSPSTGIQVPWSPQDQNSQPTGAAPPT
jgi:hypothetical protein